LLLRAFQRDFEVNGPSIVRIIRTVLQGWKKFKTHPDARIRERFAHEAANIPVRYASVLWATRKYYQEDPRRVAEITELLQELYAECGWKSRLAAPIGGRYMLRQLLQQEKMLDDGWTYEPPTFFEINFSGGPATAEQVDGIQSNPANNASSARTNEERVVHELESVL